MDAAAGDFVYIPAGEIHVEENASADEPLVVVLSRNCPDSHVVYVDEGPDGAGDVPAPADPPKASHRRRSRSQRSSRRMGLDRGRRAGDAARRLVGRALTRLIRGDGADSC